MRSDVATKRSESAERVFPSGEFGRLSESVSGGFVVTFWDSEWAFLADKAEGTVKRASDVLLFDTATEAVQCLFDGDGEG